MYAIVEIAGQQYKVEKDQQIFVNRLQGKEGSKVSFDNVLLTSDGKKVEVGAPAVKGVSVSAKIVEHLKGDKVIVFKKKRRKGYKVKNGHRPYLSKIEIESIGASKGTAKKSASKKSTASKTAEDKASEASTKKSSATQAKASKAKAESKTKAKAEKPAAKRSTTKKDETKKTAAKKAETKKATSKKSDAKQSDKTKKEDK